MQSDLFTRAQNVRPTSRAAYKEVKESGKVGRDEQLILDLMLRHWLQGNWTRREIADALSLETSTVAARVNDLIHKRFMLREDHKRPCSVTGKTVMTVRLPK